MKYSLQSLTRQARIIANNGRNGHWPMACQSCLGGGTGLECIQRWGHRDAHRAHRAHMAHRAHSILTWSNRSIWATLTTLMWQGLLSSKDSRLQRYTRHTSEASNWLRRIKLTKLTKLHISGFTRFTKQGWFPRNLFRETTRAEGKGIRQRQGPRAWGPANLDTRKCRWHWSVESAVDRIPLTLVPHVDGRVDCQWHGWLATLLIGCCQNGYLERTQKCLSNSGLKNWWRQAKLEFIRPEISVWHPRWKQWTACPSGDSISALSRPEHRRRVHLLSPCLSITCRTFLRVTAVLGCLKWCQMVSDRHTFNWLRLTVTRLPITQTQPNEALKFLRALRIWDIHETCFFSWSLQPPNELAESTGFISWDTGFACSYYLKAIDRFTHGVSLVWTSLLYDLRLTECGCWNWHEPFHPNLHSRWRTNRVLENGNN